MLSRGQTIIALSGAILGAFSSSEWTELGYLTDTDDWTDRHPRLLRSLSWGDDDYKGHVLDALKHILDKDPANLSKLLEYQPIADWLKKHDEGAWRELAPEPSELEVPHIAPRTSSDTGLAALADAQMLLRTRGATSAVDRVHTGLHDFMRAACGQALIEYPPDASANQLLKLLLEKHGRLKDIGPRTDDIRRMIRASAAIVDAMGTLRNNASLAHPNEELLGPDEALFVINLARSLLRFLDSKISAGGKP